MNKSEINSSEKQSGYLMFNLNFFKSKYKKNINKFQAFATQSPTGFSSSSSTFMSLQDRRFKTLEEFSGNISGSRSEQQILMFESKFVALELIALWTHRYPENRYNFANRYVRYSNNLFGFDILRPNMQETSREYYTYDTDTIVKDNKIYSRNLGALIYLNILLGGIITDNNLHIIKPQDNDYFYFVQNERESFFYDFFDPAYRDGVKNNDKFIKSNNHLNWWDNLFKNEEIFSKDMLNEMFATAFRVYTTPDDVIDLIIVSLLGEKYKFSEFRKHLFDIKKQALSYLDKLLSAADYDLMNDYKSSQGISVITNFSLDVANFIKLYNECELKSYLDIKLSSYDSSLQKYIKYINLEIFYNSKFINLPWPLKNIDVNENHEIQLSEVICIIECIFKLIANKWDTVSYFSQLPIWQYFDSVANYLIESKIKSISFDLNRDFILALFVFAAKQNLNYLCVFLLNEYLYISKSTLSSSSYTNSVFSDFIGKKINECLDSINNKEILNLVNNKLSPINMNLLNKSQEISFEKSAVKFEDKILPKIKTSIEPTLNNYRRRRNSISEGLFPSLLPGTKLPENKSVHFNLCSYGSSDDKDLDLNISFNI